MFIFMITFENIISDRGSKYSVSGCSVSNKLEIKNAIKFLKTKKKYAKATHNTWAVIFSNEGAIKSDDGESGAGLVTVRMLERKGIYDHLVVVTRWFGGVQLGGDRFRRVQDCVRYYFENYMN